MGVLAITRVFSVFVIGGAAVIALCFGFIGKISALISSVPSAVMGGVSFLLFGIIASSGLRMLIDNKLTWKQAKPDHLIRHSRHRSGRRIYQDLRV
ncbi:solute carrier family 23 protein [Bacillus licheniformis]|nr:solute carrier family 23 protein [Bacillus licheniformis]